MSAAHPLGGRRARPRARAHRRARRGARGRGRAARLDAAVRRPLAADDDRLGDPQRAARLAGAGRLLRPGAHRWRERSPAARRPAGVRGRDGAVTRRVAHAAAAGTTTPAAARSSPSPPATSTHIHTFRFLQGSVRPGAIVLDQQMAATLQARDRRHRSRSRRAPGGPPCGCRVSGVALITAPDVLFQPLNPLLGPAPAQPPANAAIMPLATFAATIARRAADDRGRRRRGPPPSPGAQERRAVAGPGPGRSARPRRHTRAGVHARGPDRSPRRALAAGPGAVRRQPLGQAQHRRRRRAVRGDAVHHARGARRARRRSGSRTSPRSGTVERDRRDLALLRARGATRRALLGVAVLESLAIGAARGSCSAPAPRFGAVSLIIGGSLGLTSRARLGDRAGVHRAGGRGRRSRPASAATCVGVAQQRQREPAQRPARDASRCGSGCTSTSSRSC